MYPFGRRQVSEHASGSEPLDYAACLFERIQVSGQTFAVACAIDAGWIVLSRERIASLLWGFYGHVHLQGLSAKQRVVARRQPSRKATLELSNRTECHEAMRSGLRNARERERCQFAHDEAPFDGRESIRKKASFKAQCPVTGQRRSRRLALYDEPRGNLRRVDLEEHAAARGKELHGGPWHDGNDPIECESTIQHEREPRRRDPLWPIAETGPNLHFPVAYKESASRRVHCAAALEPPCSSLLPGRCHEFRVFSHKPTPCHRNL